MTKALAIYELHSRRMFAILALVCAVSAFCYGAFLLEAVAHTAARARASHDAEAIRSKLAQVESRYFTLQQALTPELAASLGLVSPAQKSVVYAAPSGRVLTLNSTALTPQ